MGISLLARKLLSTGFWAQVETGPDTLAQQLAFAAGPSPRATLNGKAQPWMVKRQGPPVPL